MKLIMGKAVMLALGLCCVVLVIGAGAKPVCGLAPKAPAEADIIFDGKNFDQLNGPKGGPVKWKLVDGAMEIVPGTGNVTFKKRYRSFHMHLEYMLPEDEKNTNSGIYINQRYEVQIIDSYQKEDIPGMCASIYRKKIPDYNVCKPPLHWQSYEIIFRDARWDGDKKIENARITLIHNGVVVHNNAEVTSKTGKGSPEGPSLRPILLQDHNAKVKFRNIWVVPMNEKPLPADSKKAH